MKSGLDLSLFIDSRIVEPKEMKHFYLIFFVALCFSAVRGQGISSAWVMTDAQGQTNTLIMAGNFFSVSTYSDEAFVTTYGGGFAEDGNKLICTLEFHASDPEKVGTTMNLNLKKWENLDEGTPGDLGGAWLITGRMRNGEMTQRSPGPRKTMKILSGSRFQWIAYNTETRQFMGTGGGTYTTDEGKYIENIEFFSRDQTRVGAALSFDFELKEGKWHHSGKSSKGKDIYEVWGLR